MPAECSPPAMQFARLDGRDVVADFGGGVMTSDAGALLLGATDRAIGLVDRFAACFLDGRAVHDVATLVGQRVFGIALGYEDLIDHDALRHDPVLGVVLGRLEAGRAGCAPLAGKSTLNRLEHAPSGAHRYRWIGHEPEAIETLFVDLFLDAHGQAPERLILDLDATDDPLHGHQEGRFFHGYYDCYCYLPLYIFCGDYLLAGANPRFVVTSLSTAGGTSPRPSTAPEARWRTASRSASSTSSQTAPRLTPCAPTSSASGSPPWPTCCWRRSGASHSPTPALPAPPAARSASSC